MIPEKGNYLTRNLDNSVAKLPGVAVEVSFNTLQDITKEMTTVLVSLIQGKNAQLKQTVDWLKWMRRLKNTFIYGCYPIFLSKRTF